MLKKWTVLLFLVVCCSFVSNSHADTYTRGKSDHPLRYVAYLFYPVGIAVEYVVLRPVHKFVSRDPQATIFGHQPQPTDEFPGWAGRKRFDDTKARTPLYTFMTQEPAKDCLQMMQEEMEAEACARCNAVKSAPPVDAPPPPAAIEVEVAPAPVSEGPTSRRIQVEIAESA